MDRTRKVPDQDLTWLLRHARLALREIGVSGELRVRIVGDQEMTAVHGRHSGLWSTTDVLTFDMRDAAQGECCGLDADVFVCLDEAARQGAARGHGTARELLLYIVHAALHCAGFDDLEDAKAAAMHEREDEILRAIGVGAVYTIGPETGGSP